MRGYRFFKLRLRIVEVILWIILIGSWVAGFVMPFVIYFKIFLAHENSIGVIGIFFPFLPVVGAFIVKGINKVLPPLFNKIVDKLSEGYFSKVDKNTMLLSFPETKEYGKDTSIDFDTFIVDYINRKTYNLKLNKMAFYNKEKNKFILIYCFILFIQLVILHFHPISIVTSLLLIGLVAVVYFILLYVRVTPLKVLMKVIKSRPNEDMDLVITSLANEPVKKSLLFRVLAIVITIVVTEIIFIKPHLLYEKNENGGYTLRYYTIGLINNNKVEIPDTHSGLPVTEIRGEVFKNVTGIDEVILPKDLIEIRGYAFYNSSITKIEIPSKVTRIGAYAFANCSNLNSVIMHDGIKEIGAHAFENSSKFANVNLPSGLEEIEAYTFANTGLVSIELPDGLIRVGAYSFADCKNLSYVSFPEGFKTVGANAFENSGVVSLKFPTGISKIGAYSFQNCKHLQEVIIPDGIEEIGTYAFASTGISSIAVPKIDKIHEGTFSNCSRLEEVTLKSGLTIIGAHAFENTNIEEIIIPEGTTEIHARAFYGCSLLKKAHIPSSVMSIGSSAFRSCYSLSEVTINRRCNVNEKAFKDSPTVIKYY